MRRNRRRPWQFLLVLLTLAGCVQTSRPETRDANAPSAQLAGIDRRLSAIEQMLIAERGAATPLPPPVAVRLAPARREAAEEAGAPAGPMDRRATATVRIPPRGTPTSRPGGMQAFESDVLNLHRARSEAAAAAPRAGPVAARAAPRLELHFIDVGQGDCTLVITPNGKRLLVDCGSTTGGFDWMPVRDYIVALLDPNDPRIHALVITHPDTDHYKFLPDVLENIEVDHVYTVGPTSEFTVNGVDEWLGDFPDSRYTVLKNSDFTSSTPKRLGSIDFGNVDVFVLAANVVASSSASNARSIVLKVTFNNFDALLTGDATFATEKDIVSRFGQNPDFLDVEVLKIGHHGSETTSTSQDWADAIKPETAVVSCAFENTHGHPRRNVLNRLEGHTKSAPAHTMREYVSKSVSSDVPSYIESIYSTATNGNIVITSSGTTSFTLKFDQ